MACCCVAFLMSLKLYNSLNREKQEFVPIDPAHIRLYACGPTVYDYAHIGNARMAVVFDLWARVLRYLYPQSKVTYVSNITDVDDKIMRAAEKTGQPIADITEKYTAIYNDDMAALGVKKPDIQPKATTHIAEMVALIQILIEKGHAYEAQGHVLFHVPSDPSYGVLSGRSRDEQVAGARVEVAPYKKDPADFVLWKPSEQGQPGWDSPFGFGRPGWHIECSAMAQKHLGLPFDIHGGGADLKFPHHENEIAQSCCAADQADKPESFARYWVHNGFLSVEGEKMSKSLGNFLLVHDLIKEHNGEVLRLAFLSAHYRQPLDWSAQVLHQSQKLLDRLYRKMEELADIAVEDEAVQVPPAIEAALCDDLNTPLVMAELNKLVKEKQGAALKGALLGVADLLGILQQSPQEWFGGNQADTADCDVEKIEGLIAARQSAKADKDFAKADAIRDELISMGIEIKDTREGTSWQKAG